MAKNRNLISIMSAALMGAVLVSTPASAAPPKPPVANPVLVYLNKSGALEVANADGGANTVLRSGVAARRPTWAPGGAGTELNPWYITYEANYCIALKRFAVWKTASGGLTTSSAPDLTIRTSSPGGDDCATAVDVSPIGDRLVFGEAYTSDFPSSLKTMDAAGGNELAVYGAPGESTITWASYNNDGTRIAFIEDGTNGTAYIKTIDSVGTETPVKRFTTGGRYLEWSPDGLKLAFSTGTAEVAAEGVFVMDATGIGTPVRKVSGVGASWSADSSKLAFSGGGGVSVIDLNTGIVKLLVRGAHHPKFRN